MNRRTVVLRILAATFAAWIVSTASPAIAAPHALYPSSAPNAQTLLNNMGRAMKARNTVHITIDATIRIGKQAPIATHSVEDISYRPVQFKYETTSHGIHTAIVASAGRIATLLTGRWICLPQTQLAQQFKSMTGNFTPKTTGARTVGAATVDGVSTWHVQAQYDFSSGASRTTMPANIYIAQSDNTLVELVGSLTSKAGAGLTEQFVEKASKYGEHFSVSLPSSCKK